MRRHFLQSQFLWTVSFISIFRSFLAICFIKSASRKWEERKSFSWWANWPTYAPKFGKSTYPKCQGTNGVWCWTAMSASWPHRKKIGLLGTACLGWCRTVWSQSTIHSVAKTLQSQKGGKKIYKKPQMNVLSIYLNVLSYWNCAKGTVLEYYIQLDPYSA